MSSVSEPSQQSMVTRRQSKLRRDKSAFAHGDEHEEVPNNILDVEEDDDQTLREAMVEEALAPEPLRLLSPPPSELDYTLGQTRGESIADIYNDEFC